MFTSTGTGGGQEQTITFLVYLAHHGMTLVPLGYGIPVFDISEVNGGTYGASTIAGGDGSRQPVRKNWRLPASRAVMWLKLLPNCTVDAFRPAPRRPVLPYFFRRENVAGTTPSHEASWLSGTRRTSSGYSSRRMR